MNPTVRHFALTSFLTVAIVACRDAPLPSAPDRQSPRRMIYDDGSGTIYNGWDGWMSPYDPTFPGGSQIVQCPELALGIGPVAYDGRTWVTDNGPYDAYVQRVNRTFYHRSDGLVVDYYSLVDGARAVSDAFSVTCRKISTILPFAYFDNMTFQPIGWRIRYIPTGGGGGGGCDYQIIYDPDTCGTGESGGADDGGGGGGDTGTMCTTQHIWIDISIDEGATWSEYWDGDATVCE